MTATPNNMASAINCRRLKDKGDPRHGERWTGCVYTTRPSTTAESRHVKEPSGTKPRPGATIDLPVSTLAFGGQGIGRLDDFVVFVDGAVPGDLARVVLTKVKRRFAEARLVELLEPSPDRLAALCPHFGGCGGCRWQSLAYPVQLRYKEQQVRDSLERLGDLHEFELMPIRGMDDPWRYRNKMEFSVGKGPDGATLVGFHPPGRWDTVLPLDDCRLLPETMETVRAVTQAWLVETGIPPWEPRTLRGVVQHLTIRQAHGTGEILAALTTTAAELPQSASLADRLVSAVPALVGLVHITQPAPHDHTTPPGSRTIWGRPYLFEDLDGLRLKISLDAFFQTNTRMTQVLYEIAAATAGLSRGETVWDLYSGIGSIGALPCPRCTGERAGRGDRALRGTGCGRERSPQRPCRIGHLPTG